MSRSRHSLPAALLALLCLLALAMAPSASAAGLPPHTLDPKLSLTGDCSVTVGLDEVPDPDCPYQAPPAGPSGRFDEPWSVAIDAYGNEYVGSFGDPRIDIFDDEGSFIGELTLPRVPKGTAVDSKGNLYVFMKDAANVEKSEVRRFAPTGEYKPEEGKITYGSPGVIVISNTTSEGSVAVDSSNDHLYVSWSNTFFDESSSAEEGNAHLATITDPALHSNTRLAVDGQRRRIYASTCRGAIFECYVLVFDADAPHALLGEIEGTETPAGEFRSGNGWLGLAVDESNGHLFVGDLGQTKNIYEFDDTYKYAAKTEVKETAGPSLIQLAVSNSPLDLNAKNYRYLFAPQNQASGSVLAFKPPLVAPPTVKDPNAANIGEAEAELRATVESGIDPETNPTGYEVEYVTQAQFEAGGFAEAVTAGTGSVPSGSPAHLVGAFATGLLPGQEYRFRVHAENGVGEDEGEGSFTTYSDSPITPAAGCANRSLRVGPAALLPDCRAYELVTPPDTNGNPVKGGGAEGDRFGSLQASPGGEAISFELVGGALPGYEGTGFAYGDPYKATRGASGWSTALVGPSGAQTSQPGPGGFSPDQGYDFWRAGGEGTAVGNRESHYVHYPDGHSALIGRGSLGDDPYALGRLITDGGAHIVFETVNVPELFAPQLEPDAPPQGTLAVYDRTADEVTHVVSLLPGDVTPGAGQNATYRGASADGNGIAFEIGSTLYLRLDNTTTYEVATGATFAGVSQGGGRVFYLKGGDLRAFDTATEATLDFTPGIADAVPVNVAPEGNRAYFVSEEAIAGSGQNPNGASPQAGAQNLYLSTEGTISFLATVTKRDVVGEENTAVGRLDGLGLWAEALRTRRPGFDPSRLNPDGSVLLFQSRADLDGYDPGAAPQVYRYDSAGALECISCPPTKAPATGGAALQSFIIKENSAPFGPYSYAPNLRADGKRAFFESTEALVSTDTDRRRDVYEWEAEGVGSCDRPSGCVYPISPGDSPSDEYLFGQSASGEDVFFTTDRTLVPGDQSTLSVYDARVGGGIAAAQIPGECLGEACQPQAQAPADTSPASAAFRGPGNVKPPPAKARCPKGRHAGRAAAKSRCAAKKHHKKHRRARAAKGARR